MAKEQATGPWTIVSAVLRPSKYHEGEYTYITMSNSDNEIVHTNIEDNFKNNGQWSNVIKALDDNYNVVIDNLYYKKSRGKFITDSRTNNRVIDADSMPHIVSVNRDHVKAQEAANRKVENNQRLSEIEETFSYENGKWDISACIKPQRSYQKEFSFNDDLKIKATDTDDDMKIKYRLRSLVTTADMLNKGYEFND